LARERADSGESRLAKIEEFIEGSRYSIHDLSRCQAATAGEYYRLNMPFELGIDHACRKYFGQGRDTKKILILEEQRHRYKAALSDLSGCDVEAHGGQFDIAVRKVRNWLVNEAGALARGAGLILRKYVSFQEWNYKRQLLAGFSDEDIQDYPTKELLDAMVEWVAAGEP